MGHTVQPLLSFEVAQSMNRTYLNENGNNMSRKDSLSICRVGNKVLCKVRVAPSKNAEIGEVDVFVDSKSGHPFEQIIAQRPDGEKLYKGEIPINNTSWHGNFLKDGKKPKINLKQDSRRIVLMELDNVITQERIFLFPIFSLSAPLRIDQNETTKNLRTDVIELQRLPLRIDFFLLPKDIAKETFEKLSICSFQSRYDVIMYDRSRRGPLIPLDRVKYEIFWHKFRDWWAFIRCVYASDELISYCLHFHDTFAPWECVLDRGCCSSLGDPDQFEGRIWDLHEKDLISLGIREQISNKYQYNP